MSLKNSSRFQIKVAEQILDEAIMDNKPHYLIKWRYLPHEYDTWESIENLESIVHMIKEWINTKRNTKQVMNYVASYCETVNYIDPTKKRTKRKMTSKTKKIRKTNNQVVILDDEENFNSLSMKNIKNQQSFINDQQSSSFIEQQKNYLTGKTKWSQQLYPNEIQQNEEQKNIIRSPLNFNPQINENETIQTNELRNLNNVGKGMKVIGRVRSQDIEKILEHFLFKQTLCFKIQLIDKRLTNMREQDLKKLCPQMLMQYYEYNDIKV